MDEEEDEEEVIVKGDKKRKSRIEDFQEGDGVEQQRPLLAGQQGPVQQQPPIMTFEQL